MKIVCAWCGKEMGEKPGGEGVTHSICSSCREEQKKKIEDEKKKREEEQKK